MKTIGTIISLAFVALVIYIAWNIAAEYKRATGTIWERLLAAGRNSATMLWGKFCLLLAGIVANLDPIVGAIGGDDARNFVNTYVGDPKIVAAVMLVMSLVSMAARLRTL